MSEDDLVRDLILSSASDAIIDDGPTVFSLEDPINIMINRFGEDWMKNHFAKSAVVWNSSSFIREHVKEVCEKYPGLLELCEEYFRYKTIEGKPLADSFYVDILYFMESYWLPKSKIREHFGTSPVKDCWFHDNSTLS